jgi:hypothetical protein
VVREGSWSEGSAWVAAWVQERRDRGPEARRCGVPGGAGGLACRRGVGVTGGSRCGCPHRPRPARPRPRPPTSPTIPTHGDAHRCGHQYRRHRHPRGRRRERDRDHSRRRHRLHCRQGRLGDAHHGGHQDPLHPYLRRRKPGRDRDHSRRTGWP